MLDAHVESRDKYQPPTPPFPHPPERAPAWSAWWDAVERQRAMGIIGIVKHKGSGPAASDNKSSAAGALIADSERREPPTRPEAEQQDFSEEWSKGFAWVNDVTPQDLPGVPFDLAPSITIWDKRKFLDGLQADIARGPEGPRARKALPEDCRLLRRLLDDTNEQNSSAQETTTS